MKSRIFIKLFLVVVSSVLALPVEARVFNFKRQTVSVYLRGAYGINKLQKYAFEPGFPTSVSFPDSSVNQNYSGELGLALTTNFTTRLGVELLYPQLIKDIEGRNSSNTNLMSVVSQVYAVIPQVNIEIPIRAGAKSKFYVMAGGGYAVSTFKNTVTMTAAGTSTLGVTDYIEEGTGNGFMGQGGGGVEFSFVDNVSLSFDLGYRYLVVNNYTANRDATTANGPIYKGNAITNVDGSKRTTDLSGPWAAMSFRFYIN
jgi:hypothetical protein